VNATISNRAFLLRPLNAPQASLQWVLARPDIDRSKIWVYGQSLGGAVAIWLASRHQREARKCPYKGGAMNEGDE